MPVFDLRMDKSDRFRGFNVVKKIIQVHRIIMLYAWGGTCPVASLPRACAEAKGLPGGQRHDYAFLFL